MKCLSCGNLIPDASTVCPYCNSKVEPTASVAPVYAENAFTSVATPVTPDLPVAQPGMAEPVVQPVQEMVSAPVASVATEVPTTPVVNQTVPVPTTPEVVAPVIQEAQAVAPVVPETPAQPVLPQDQGMVVAPVAPTPEVATPVAEPIVPAPAPTTTMVSQGITPPPTFGGEKIASTVDAPKKKMSKGMLIGIIVAVVVVLVAAGLGIFYYTSQYKSADKRLDAIINTVFKDLVAIKNEELELGSGTYEVSASISANDSTLSSKINGIYAFDVQNQIADYTLNIESLQLGQELLDAGELNFELYVEGSKVYFLLQNFYDKYIYVDTEGLVVEEENNKKEEETIELDYQKLIIALREATKSAFKAANKTQTVGEVNIGGTKTKANIIEIALNEANGKKMVKAMQNSLANNKNFTGELAKVTGKTEEEVKEAILGTGSENESEEDDIDYEVKSTTVGTLKVYTAMFGDEFLGTDVSLSITYDKTSEYYDAEIYEDQKFELSIYPKGEAVITTLTNNGEKLLELSIEEGYDKNSTEEINTYKFNMSIPNEEAGATNIKFEYKVTSHLQPKVDKVVVKNIINAENMTEQDLDGILAKIKGYGTFGIMVDSIITSMMPTEPENPYLDYNEPYTDMDLYQGDVEPSI